MARKHIGFAGLARRVEAEYRRKGYSAKRAHAIGIKTAGKVRGEISAMMRKRR